MKRVRSEERRGGRGQSRAFEEGRPSPPPPPPSTRSARRLPPRSPCAKAAAPARAHLRLHSLTDPSSLDPALTDPPTSNVPSKRQATALYPPARADDNTDSLPPALLSCRARAPSLPPPPAPNRRSDAPSCRTASAGSTWAMLIQGPSARPVAAKTTRQEPAVVVVASTRGRASRTRRGTTRSWPSARVSC